LDGATREAYSRAFGLTQPGGGVPDPAGIWGGCARVAIAAAMMMARHAGRSCARPIDLLQAVLADPPSSVRSLLEACGISPTTVIDAARAQGQPSPPAPPWTPLLSAIRWSRILDNDQPHWLDRITAAAVARALTLGGRVEPVLLALELEAARQAVRTNTRPVTTT